MRKCAVHTGELGPAAAGLACLWIIRGVKG